MMFVNDTIHAARYLRPVLMASTAIIWFVYGLIDQHHLVAQSVKVGQSTPPYFVGEPFTVQIAVEGFDSTPQPTCKVLGQIPDGIEIQATPPSRQVSTYESRINGRVTRTENVRLRFNFLISASRAGTYSIGPFEVKQGSVRIEKPEITFSVGDVEIDDDMKVEISMPQRPLYLGERVPIDLKWSYAGKINNVRNLTIRSPMFDQFSFEDAPRGRQDQGLPIRTAQGEIVLKAEVSREAIDGREFVNIKARRTLVADKLGTFEIEPVTASIRKVTRWSRDPFDDFPSPFGLRSGSRQPAASEPSRAVGNGGTINVKPLPEADKPASFSGAVGESYSIATSANRSVVRVGDPISITVTVSGNEGLERLGLPPLSADGGLSPAEFRLPSEEPVGIYSDGQKQFKIAVRVLQEGIEEIPSVAFSWFDPIREAYVTTHSDPIAVKVLSGQTISSTDVVGGTRDSTSDDTASNVNGAGQGGSAETNAAGEPPGQQALVANLDLSIDPDIDNLLPASWARNRENWTTLALYALALSIIGWILIDRRRSLVDPMLLQKRATLREQLSAVINAGNAAPRDSLEQIGNALRVAIRESTDESAIDDAERLLGDVDARLFAPATADAPLDQEIVREARQIIERMEKALR